MAPHGESIVTSYSRSTPKPPRLSSDTLKRTVSDITYELSKTAGAVAAAAEEMALPAISEAEEAKCECCGMVEEYTREYVERVRDRFQGKWVCGLCSEAVKEELGKTGGAATEAEALAAHTAACVRFNKYGRAYPVLFQAEAMREMLKKNKDGSRVRAKSISPRDQVKKFGTISRSSSCIPAITRDMTDLTLAGRTN